jgi:outer membrane protein W
MAQKTSVAGNRVTIDDNTYVVAQAGPQYAVTNDFGDRLGYFSVRGRAVTAEDWGVAGAHPLMQIGKLWVAANLVKTEEKSSALASRGVCRVTTHEKPSDADAEKARAHRAWTKKQPGCKASYFVLDPATGKALTITIWETRDQLNAAKDAAPPDGAAALRATSVEVFPMVEEP